MKPYWILSIKTELFKLNSRERARLFQCMQLHREFRERFNSKAECDAAIKCMEKDGVGGFGKISDGQMIALEAFNVPSGRI